MQSVSPEEKIPAQAVGKKKNSCKLKIPLPPHHFSNGPSLILTIEAQDNSTFPTTHNDLTSEPVFVKCPIQVLSRSKTKE